jgi:hypothetical protein
VDQAPDCPAAIRLLLLRLGPGAFLVFAAVALLSSWYAWLLVPETRGKSLTEVQALLCPGE